MVSPPLGWRLECGRQHTASPVEQSYQGWSPTVTSLKKMTGPGTQGRGGGPQGRSLTQAFSGSSRDPLGQSEELEGKERAPPEVGEAQQVLASSTAQPRAGSGRVPRSLPLRDRAGLKSMQGPGTETKQRAHQGPSPRRGRQTASSSPGACPTQDSASRKRTNIPISPSWQRHT